MAVELITNQTPLVLIKLIGVLDVIKGIEQLKDMRGLLCNIILDAHTTHGILLTDKPTDKWTKVTRSLLGNSNLLGAAGIHLNICFPKTT